MFNKIKAFKQRLNASKDGKAVASNFGYLFILQIASYIFPLLTIPYLARVIGVEGFGKIAFAAAVIVWFQTIVDWGFNYTATRDVAKCRNDNKKVSEIFSIIFWTKLFLMILVFIFLIVSIYFIPFFFDNKYILLASFSIIFGQILMSEWFFQAMEKMKYITLLSLISKFIFTISIFIFIKDKDDFIFQPILASLGSILVGFYAIYLIVFKWKVEIEKPNLYKIIIALKQSFDVFINNFLPNLYNSFSMVLVGLWGGSSANGIYDAGRKFVGITHSFMGIFTRVLFPYLSRNINNHSIFAKIQLSIAFLASLTLFFVAPHLIKIFYTEEFYDAILVLKISSISIFLIALSQVYGTNYLIVKGYTRKLRNITFFYSILGFLISFPLVSTYSYIGANITLVVIQFLIGITVMFQALKIEKNISK